MELDLALKGMGELNGRGRGNQRVLTDYEIKHKDEHLRMLV